MAMSALSTSALSSLEAMLQSLMRGSGGGGGDDDTPVDDTLASPPPPPLPARPTPRGRRPSRRRVRPAAAARTLMSPPPSSSRSPSPSPPKEREDARTDDVSLLVEGLERKAVELEAQLRRRSEEENAALKRRMESYHIRWLQYEIRIKSLEEAFHEQMAALQLAQDAARRAEETAAYDHRESSEHHVDAPEDPLVRLWHGRDRMVVGARRSAVSRLGAEFRRQSHTLERGAAALVAEEPAAAAPSGGCPSSSAADDLKKLKAQFRAWTKDYKARLRRTKAELGSRDARRQGSCWI